MDSQPIHAWEAAAKRRRRWRLRWVMVAAAIMVVDLSSAWWCILWQNEPGTPAITLAPNNATIRARVGVGWIMVARGPVTGGKPGSVSLGFMQREGWHVFAPGKFMEKRWRFQWHTGQVTIPIWTLAAAALVPAAVSWVRERYRRAPGSCAKCGYPMAGLGPDAPCPECGGKRRMPGASPQEATGEHSREL